MIPIEVSVHSPEATVYTMELVMCWFLLLETYICTGQRKLFIHQVLNQTTIHQSESSAHGLTKEDVLGPHNSSVCHWNISGWGTLT